MRGESRGGRRENKGWGKRGRSKGSSRERGGRKGRVREGVKRRVG